MTPCPKCSWPHHSHKPIALTCAKCGTLVVIGEVEPERLRTAVERQEQLAKKQRKQSRAIAWVRWLRAPEDRGLGDTVERLLAKAGGRQIKALLAVMGIPCGCGDRQKWLNEHYPY